MKTDIQFEAADTAVPQDKMEYLLRLANQLTERKAAVEEAERELTAAKQSLADIEHGELPELMTELGLENLRLANGATISIEQSVSASIPKARMGEAVEWLAERNFDGIVKTQVVAKFKRGERAEADSLADQLIEQYGPDHVSLDMTIHPQTLKAFVRERIAEGKPVPTDLFGVFIQPTATVRNGSR